MQVFCCMIANQPYNVGVREAAKMVVKEVEPFYIKAGIPRIRVDAMAVKIIKLYTEIENLLKQSIKLRGTKAYKKKLAEFKEKLKKTLHFWPKDAMSRITNESDRRFLRSMMGNRNATIGSFDRSLTATERKILI